MEAVHKFTMLALFARAIIFVQIVMILLLAASVWCWAVIIDKTIQYRKVGTKRNQTYIITASRMISGLVR